MMPFVGLIVLLWLGLSGVVRVVAPAWQLNVDKKHAKSAEAQAATDERRLKRIRISGAVRLAVLAALVWAAGMSIGLSRAPSRTQRASDLEKLLFERGSEFVRDGKTAGLTIAAIAGMREAVVEVGFSNLGSRTPVTKDTLFEIGSITKVFTGIALAQQVEAGELKLDQPVASLLPKEFGISPEAQAVTLGQLSTHTSGFPRLPGNPRICDIVNF